MILRATLAVMLFPVLAGAATTAGDYGAEITGYLERGIAAAGRQDWAAAISQFSQAQTRVPRGPQILFNLGLAHANAGHELIGAAWLKAYLAVAPQATDSAKASWEISRLKAAHEEKTAKLFALAYDAWDDIPDRAQKRRARLSIAASQSASGDIHSALRAASQTGDLADHERSRLWRLYALSLTASWEPEWVRPLMDHLSVPADRDEVSKEAILAYLDQRDRAGARRIHEKAKFEDPALGQKLAEFIDPRKGDEVFSTYTPGNVFGESYDAWLDWSSLAKEWTASGETLDLDQAVRKWSRQDRETGKALSYERIPGSIGRLGLALGKMSIAVRKHENHIAWSMAHARRAEIGESYAELGYKRAKNGDFVGAAAAYRRALEARPDDPSLCKDLANALLDSGQEDGAIAGFRKAIALGLKDDYIHFRLAWALSGKGQTDEAIEQFRQAVALDPKDKYNLLFLGWELHSAERIDEAIVQYRRTLAVAPGWATAHNQLGLALADKGKLDDAAAQYRKSIASDPKSGDAHNNLALVLVDKGQPKDALAAYDKAITLTPDNALYHHNRALARYNNGDFAQATADWTKAIELDPSGKEEYALWIERSERAHLMKEAGAEVQPRLSEVKGLALWTAQTETEEGLIPAKNEASGETIYLRRMLRLSRAHLKSVSTDFDEQQLRHKVLITLNDEGARLFAHITRVLSVKKEQLAIVVDGRVISAPTVQDVIHGNVQITGNFDPKEAERLADSIRGHRLRKFPMWALVAALLFGSLALTYFLIRHRKPSSQVRP